MPNNLFFNYDKLAKDGVIEEVDWTNPDREDDESEDEELVKRAEADVKDATDTIQRTEDIASDLKRTIDSINTNNRVSQEDRAALECFVDYLDTVKTLPSMESYTVKPSKVNLNKTLEVANHMHDQLINHLEPLRQKVDELNALIESKRK